MSAKHRVSYLGFWQALQNVAKQCERSTQPAPLPTCMHHGGDMPPGRVFCAKAAPRRGEDKAEPQQLALFGGEP